jgi:acetyltransferase EpsM
MQKNKIKLIIVGGGEQAKVVYDAAKDVYNILGYIDKDPTNVNIKYLGADKVIHSLIEKYPLVKLIWGIGSNKLREKLYNIYKLDDSRYTTIIHSSSQISDSAILEPGVFVAAGAIIQPSVIIKKHSIVNTGSIIEHDCEIGAYAHIAPGVVIGGGCSVGTKAFIGLGSSVKDHVSIGADTIVGAGSVVINSVKEKQIVAGVPVKNIKSSK